MIKAKIHKWCVWSGLFALVLWLGGFWFLSGFMPPPSPNNTAEEFKAIFTEDVNMLRLGLLLTLWGSAFFGPFIAVVSVQMKRIEGTYGPLTYTQLALGAILVLEFIIPMLILQAAAYRPERSAEEIQSLNDVAWFLFIGLVSTACLEILVVGIAILSDDRPDPVFPRWVGYLSLWAALLIVPGGFCVYFKTGPLAWNGIFSWWVPVTVFCTWMGVMMWQMSKNVDRGLFQDEASDTPGLVTQEELETLRREVSDLRDTLAGSGRA